MQNKIQKIEELSFEDILHYQKIIGALTETDRIMNEIDKIDENNKQIEEKKDDENKTIIESENIDDRIQVEYETPKQYYLSHILMLFALFENNLVQILEDIFRKKPIAVKNLYIELNKEFASSLGKYLWYFKVIKGIDLTAVDIYWATIDELRYIRNIITHSRCPEDEFFEIKNQDWIKDDQELNKVLQANKFKNKFVSDYFKNSITYYYAVLNYLNEIYSKSKDII